MPLLRRPGKAAPSRLQFGELAVDVVQKKVKNLRLSVHAPEGRVRVSAPLAMSLASIRAFITSRLGWIQAQQIRLRAQAYAPELAYSDGERHYFRGQAYALKVSEHKAAPSVLLAGDSLELRMRPGSTAAQRQRALFAWYRAQLKHCLPAIIAKYEVLMVVKVHEFGIKRMRTRWGTCNPVAQRIWLNLELAKQSPACLEYVVVHEMTHLLERSHNRRFVALMDQFMPHWRECKHELNASARHSPR